MILSLNLNKTENLKLLMKCFFNKGLVIFDKEMKDFLLNETNKVKTSEHKLQLFWDMSNYKEVGKVISAIISLVVK